MRLEAAIEILEADLLVDNTIPLDTAHTITSAGPWEDEKKPVPALYATEILAVQAWLKVMQEHIGAANDKEDIYVRWVEKPVLYRYQITVMDTKDMHRLVSDRFSVYTRFAIIRRLKFNG